MRRLTARRWALIAAALIASASAAASLARREAQQRYAAPGPLAADIALVIPRGGHVDIARTLRAAGIIDSADHFRLAASLTASAGPLRAAEFLFPAHASLRDTLSILRTARPVQHRITLPEGLTAAQVAALLDREDALSGDTPIPGEGELLPDTYVFERGTPRGAIAERAASAMRRSLARIWAERDPGIPLKSPQDLVTLASIVERETARPDERPRVAAVFYNRLARNMRLQSDPTVIYAATGGSLAGGHTITRAELDTDHPYNTYRTRGLPPAPIATPGPATLLATAHPIASDDLYFVASPSGGHAFARTLDEHNRNVARWLTAQQR